MKRREFSAQLGLSTLGLLAASGGAQAQGGFVEGQHYQRLGQPLPSTPGKIEVVEFFWYGCPHCFAFEPEISAWAKQLPADVSFRQVHVSFRANVAFHQKVFFALEAMGKEAQVHTAIFDAIHRYGQSLDDVKTVAGFVAKLGVDPAKFEESFNSFTVNTKCMQAKKLSEDYRIDGVPALGVAGRFLTSPAMSSAGLRISEVESGKRALQVVDTLIQRIRKGG
ncbi:thiol:disulfide interchange protein DsbA/DsbL [Paucibacter sp. APW11]|uniref:Thiol:disulfide interchange protein DsbA n=1 Tax=Roseateles aquae TaxID=3077235 RepID=A0ABU3PAX5_9BURK|nr:thiol:disulfide interchange protein DsbA/DsbL [Paucibacter sp. APW11]MDT8999427.1 thiol:disulfide interchange protein DsbA/DsbL [Paucibacter sp. APW11]